MSGTPNPDAEPSPPGSDSERGEVGSDPQRAEAGAPDATVDPEAPATQQRPFDPGARPLGMRRAIWVDDDVSNPSLLIPAIVAGLVLALVCLALGQFILLGVMLAGVVGIVAVAELRG